MELKITPKGIAWLAMRDAGLVHTVDDKHFDLFWEKFCSQLSQNGYSLPGIDGSKLSYRLGQVEAELQKYKNTGLTMEDMAFFTSPQMAEICKRIHSAFEKGTIKTEV